MTLYYLAGRLGDAQAQKHSD